MRKLILTLIALVATLPLAYSQSAYPVAGHVGSDTTASPAMIVKYIGTGSSATVAVDASTGDIEFKVATVDDSANIDTATVCAGGTAASLDVNDAQCDTFGEVVDLINASTHWRAVLVGALRTDSLNNTLTTIGATQATRIDGLTLYFDSAVSVTATVPLIPEVCKTDIRCYMTPAGKLFENPYAGKETQVRWVEGYSTWNTTSNFVIYSVKPVQKSAGSETVTTLWSEPAGATGTNKQLTAFQYLGLKGRPHEKVLVRIVDTSTGTTFILHAYGVQTDIR
jgi:hypothetical protein